MHPNSCFQKGRSQMRYLTAASSVVLLLSVVASNAWANLTYNLVSYPAYQIDLRTGLSDTLTGSITTDGAMGQLNLNDILSFSFTSVGTYAVAGSSNVAGSGVQFQTGIGPFATSTQLMLSPSNESLFLLGSPADGGDGGNGYLVWNDSSPFWNGWDYSCKSSFEGLNLWEDPASAQDPQIPPSPWVIAQVVPEPSTLSLLIAGAAGLLAFASRSYSNASC